MKEIVLSTLFFLLVGCEEIILDNNDTEQNSSIDGLPKIYTPTGDPVSLENYLYPSLLDVDKNVYEELYSYKQDQDEKIINQPIKEISYIKTIGISNTPIITKFIDNKNVQSYYITNDAIKVSIDNKIEKEYPKEVSINSLVTETIKDSITTRCVVKSINRKDLLPLLPDFIQNDLKQYIQTEQFNLDNILHITCGTTNNIATDTYYSNKYGEVLNIEKNTTSTSAYYEIIDIKSIETR